MKKSIFTKIFAAFVLIVFVLSLLILKLSFGVVKERYMHTVGENLKHLGYTMESDVARYLSEGRIEELNRYIRKLGSRIKARVTIIGATGEVISDSERNPVNMENHKGRPEIVKALQGYISSSTRYSTTVKKDMVYVALPLRSQETIIGVLRLARFEEDIKQLLNDLKGRIVEMAAVVVFLSLGVAFLFARNLTKPIRDLREAFQRVASGDFEVKVFMENRDETKALADSFNVMTDQIKMLFEELSRQKDSLDSIIASVQAGLAVLDKSGKVVRSNSMFEKIARNPRVEGKFYWEVIREASFSDLVKDVMAGKKGLAREVSVNNRIYLCSAGVLDTQKETVVMLHDITEMKNVEKVKKDFVVNVSHELRTPLTAIKGFAETLEEDVDESARHYVAVIKRNADRLIYIIQDLLVLSELEEKGPEMALEEVDLKKVIDHAVRIFKQRLEEKALSLITSIPTDIPMIKGDPFRLEQLFINLIDNAVKYTDKGSITVSVVARDESLDIGIEDTGLGIPSQHLSRIFERFYVVDKSRSKKLGGTGLGLSIVKHIVLLHQGEIHVESVLGMGTKFIITLPVNPAS